jgi:CRISPR-associated endonuclease/helicase Cas3
MAYYARTISGAPKEKWQRLSDHLLAASSLAKSFGQALGICEASEQAALLHDLGKYTQEFQRRLEGSAERVDHSTAGAWLVWNEPAAATLFWRQLIAYAIAGHHAGLPNRIDEAGTGASLEERIDRFEHSALDPDWKTEITPRLDAIQPNISPNCEPATRGFQLAFLGRMLFSCLVDADRKDAAQFFVRAGKQEPDRTWPALQDILDAAIATFDGKVGSFRSDTPVNALRTRILVHTRSQADRDPGLFTFTVPTGGGKTLASLGFALDHARRHGHRRIIYVAPFTAIIDQTAAIYREILSTDNVLEHHSAVEDERDDPTRAREDEHIRCMRAATQDWAAPVIVTTNVQLFESLFAAKPSKCQKLHNIARSVIILDEAQTLPRHLLAPCMRAIDELTRNYGCTVILCTATQPALDSSNFLEPRSKGHAKLGLELEGRELAPDPPALAKALRRVTLRFDGARTNADLIEELHDHDQGLVIVNSRKHALALYREARTAGLQGLVHLSTRQCGLDRKQILKDIRQHLKEGATSHVIATSLVEAGVDLDFPRVWRAAAGLDQIAQAAGRCNREGKRSVEESIVSVFDAPDFPPPSEIRNLTGDLSRIMEKNDDLFSPDAMEDYFREVYWRVGHEGLDREGILGLLSTVDRTGVHFSYRTAAEKFRMIESGMVPVIIDRDERSAEAIRRLGVEAVSSGGLARALQPYIVQVPPRARARLISNGRATFAYPAVRGDQFCVLTDPNLYTQETGLLWEDADYLSIENQVWS